MTRISMDPEWNSARLTEMLDVELEDLWREVVASVPRHVFTPRWWEPHAGGSWIVRDGPALAEDRRGAWSAAIDTNREVVIRVGRLHADDARPGDHASGPATEKSSDPGDVFPLFEYADVQPGCTVLLTSAASGYECALLSRLLGGPSVTALADETTAARIRPRLAALGLGPELAPRPSGSYDCMISAVPGPVSAACLFALAPGGKLAALLPSGTLVARKCPDGTARGHAQLWTEPPAGPFSWFGEPSVVPVTVHPGGTITLRVDDTDD